MGKTDDIMKQVQEKGAAAIDGILEGGSKAAKIAKDGTDKIIEGAVSVKRAIDTKRLGPVYREDIETFTANPPEMIYICDDPNFNDNPVMKDAIARLERKNETDMLTINFNNLELFDFDFYSPVIQGCIYYVDPYDKKMYIDLDDYFSYFQSAKMSELSLIAQKLGATYMSVKLLREKSTFVNKSSSAKIAAAPQMMLQKGKNIFDADINKSSESKESMSYELLTEMHFSGHEPEQPDLKYFKNNADIKALIDMRMDGSNTIGERHLSFKYNKGTGINRKNAGDIDAILKSLNVSGNSTVTEKVKEEDRMLLEYTIVFP